MTASDLLALGLTNAALATLLAAAGWLLTRLWTNPHVASAVWLVVLLKLVTPPFVSLPIRLPAATRLPGVASRESEVPAEPRTTGAISASVPLSLGRGVRGEGSDSAIQPLAPVRSRENKLPSTLGPFDEQRWQRTAGAARRPIAPDSTPPGKGKRIPVALPTIVLSLWLAGSLFLAVLTAARVLRFRGRLRNAMTADGAVQGIAAGVALRLGLRRCPSIRLVAANVGPLVWAGAASPVVIVPRPLWDRLGDAERETLVAHELAHVARGDHWVRRAEAVLLALYWWLPTAWFATRRREAAAESCCDALVLATYPESPQAYAEALFVAVSVLSAGRPPALASGLGEAAALKERLAMIIHDRVPCRPSRPTRLGLALAAAAALFVSARFVRAEPPRIAADPNATRTTVLSAADASDLPVIGNIALVDDNFAIIDGGSTPAEPDEEAADTAQAADALGPVAIPSRGGPEAAHGGMGGRGIGGGMRGRLPYMGSGRGMAPMMGGARGGMPMGGMGRGGRGSAMGGRGGGMSGMGIGMMPGMIADPLSDDVRSKMIASLISVIEKPGESAELKARALRSLGRVGGGSPEAEKALTAAAEQAKDDDEKLAAAEALDAVGSPKGIELMWSLLDSTQDWDLKSEVVARLDATGTTPTTADAVRTLAYLTARDVAETRHRVSLPGGSDFLALWRTGTLTSPDVAGSSKFAGATRMLVRLTESGGGVRNLVETIATTENPAEEEPIVGSVRTPDGPKSRIEAIYGTKTPVRDVLLPLLAATQPASDEVALALVEALSSEDAAIRQAAAEALGNAGGGSSGGRGGDFGSNSRPVR